MWVDCGQKVLLTLSEPETDRAVHEDLLQILIFAVVSHACKLVEYSVSVRKRAYFDLLPSSVLRRSLDTYNRACLV